MDKVEKEKMEKRDDAKEKVNGQKEEKKKKRKGTRINTKNGKEKYSEQWTNGEK